MLNKPKMKSDTKQVDTIVVQNAFMLSIHRTLVRLLL